MSNIKKIKATLNPAVSPFFSPRKTRNQRQATCSMKIEPTLKQEIETTNISSKSDVPKKRKSLAEKLISNLPESHIKIETIKTENIPETKLVKWEPKKWIETLGNLRNMRASQKAPVDDLGCDKCSDDVDEKTRRYHILIALMLSSQTKDATTHAAMQRLREYGLLPAHLIETEDETLEKLLVPVSFYKTKAKHIKKTSQILVNEYDGDIPDTINNLVKLPGVGPKMAHICMKVAWNQVTGIGVDTHVHRISKRLKWVEKPTKEAEQTRIALEKWLPFELWDEVNILLVGFGQTVCLPRFPLCDSCLNNEICPSREYKIKQPNKKNPSKMNSI